MIDDLKVIGNKLDKIRDLIYVEAVATSDDPLKDLDTIRKLFEKFRKMMYQVKFEGDE